MENIRLLLVCITALLGFVLYQAWQSDYPASSNKPATTKTTQSNPGSNTTHAAPDAESGGKEKNAQRSGNAQGSNTGNPGSIKQASKSGHGKLVQVVTDKYHLWIDTRGGDLQRVKLRDVPASTKDPKTALTLIQSKPGVFFRQTSRIIGKDNKSPTRHQFKTDKTVYRLGKNKKALSVPLTWTGANGRVIKKTFHFERGSYQIGLTSAVHNDSKQPWTVSNYVRFWRSPSGTRKHAWFIPSTFSGVGWYQKNTDSSDFAFQSREQAALSKNPLDLTQTGGWIAIVEHYFIAAAIPGAKTKARFFATPKTTSDAPDAYAAGFRTAQVQLAPRKSTDFKTRLFVGPKLQNQLGAVASGLSLTVDYGFMTILAKPIFHILSFLHSIVGNWGVAIILLTMFIKLCFFKLSEKQYRAMARMRKFQPRMQQLKEQYGDDRQQLQSKMMELYKKEGFNPLAGCWPMLIQAPVFIVLYWVLLESAEIRAAPFLWIQDLSSPDPFYILPIFFGVTMFIQQRLTMTTAMDPIQQRLMQVMPIGLAIFFTFFPAGLVLYWCTNNSLSIAQQWYIYKKLDSEGLGHKAHTS